MVGQTVYLKTITHLNDCWKKEKIAEGVVTKIGRKYITVKDLSLRDHRFNIENDFREETEYSAVYDLFLTKQSIYDYWQSAYLQVEIRNYLSRNGQRGKRIPLRTLKEAAKVFGIPIDYWSIRGVTKDEQDDES